MPPKKARENDEAAAPSATTKKRRKGSGPVIPRRKKPKDMPRRPLSAYNIFFREERARILAKYKAGEAQADFEVSAADESEHTTQQESKEFNATLFQAVARTIASRWKRTEDKSHYEERAMAEKEIYRKKVEDYEEKMVQSSGIAKKWAAAVGEGPAAATSGSPVTADVGSQLASSLLLPPHQLQQLTPADAAAFMQQAQGASGGALGNSALMGNYADAASLGTGAASSLPWNMSSGGMLANRAALWDATTLRQLEQQQQQQQQQMLQQQSQQLQHQQMLQRHASQQQHSSQEQLHDHLQQQHLQQQQRQLHQQSQQQLLQQLQQQQLQQQLLSLGYPLPATSHGGGLSYPSYGAGGLDLTSLSSSGPSSSGRGGNVPTTSDAASFLLGGGGLRGPPRKAGAGSLPFAVSAPSAEAAFPFAPPQHQQQQQQQGSSSGMNANDLVGLLQLLEEEQQRRRGPS